MPRCISVERVFADGGILLLKVVAMLDGAARAGRAVERKVVARSKENPVAAGIVRLSVAATHLALKNVNQRVDCVEQRQDRDRAKNRQPTWPHKVDVAISGKFLMKVRVPASSRLVDGGPS